MMDDSDDDDDGDDDGDDDDDGMAQNQKQKHVRWMPQWNTHLLFLLQHNTIAMLS